MTTDRHPEPLRLGILAPLIAGAYMTRVMAGVARVAAGAGFRLIAIQTLDPGIWGTEITAPPPAGQWSTGHAEAELAPPAEATVPRYVLRTAWDHVAGFVVMLTAVEPGYLRALREAGKPVVLVSDEVEGFACPVVRADNRSGVTEAVDHLVQHGHRRIAFAGSLRQVDIRDRLDAYRQALSRHGLTADPDLLFPTSDNLEGGGEIAGQRMLAAGLTSTAVVAGTDYNALGIMRALSLAGLSLPHDQAVVGFDDVPEASAVRPTLATVHQSADEIGATAARLLLDLVRRRPVSDGSHLVRTTFVPRESCGCAARATVLLTEPASSGAPSGPRDLLRDRLERLLLVGEPVAPLQAKTLDRAVDLLAVCVEPDPREPADLARAFAEAGALLCAVSPRLTMVTTAVACLRQHWDDVTAPPGGRRDAAEFERRVAQLTIELCRAVAEREAITRTELQLAMDQEHDVDSSLIRGSTGDPRLLGWLWYTPVRAACLGLWPEAGSGGATDRDALEMVSSYARDGDGPRLPVRSRVEQFPPAAFVDAASWERDEMAVVLPTMTTTSDLGLLAMVIRIAATEVAGRDRLFDKGALLGISIEREVMTERLRRSNVDLATFSQAMAHDLRNSVATISMWASVARARGAAGEEAQSLLRIMDQVKHVAGYAGDLVADLLRFAEAAPGSAPRVPVDLNLAAGRSLATLEAEITERHAVVETRDLPTVLGTFSDLELVLRHLIDNAIRHGGNPMPLVRLEAELDGPAWTIRCSDNGHGIPARLRDRVFEPLARGDRDSAGSGLGLATCRRIVEGLGGRIWIVASGRQGTTIAFCLPSTPERRSTSGTAGAVTGGLGTGRGPG